MERDGAPFCRACFTGGYPVPVDPGAGKLSMETLHRIESRAAGV